MDAIDQVLDGLELQSSVFSRMEVSAGWGFAKPCLEGAPFHIVLAGEAWVGHDTSDLIKLVPGEMAILPRGEAHLLLSAPGAEAISFKKVAAARGFPEWRPGLRLKPMVLRIGPPGPAVARLVTGIFEVADRRRNPLLAALPDILVLRDSPAGATIASLIDEEVGAARPGSRLVAGRLADYLFIQAVRDHVVTHPGGNADWLNGVRDPAIGHALTLIHAEPGRDWSVGELARAVSLSRSQFAQRFKAKVGRGPIEYLRDWRMFTAASRLDDARLSLKEIARLAGYRSVAAFGRAFKDWGGRTPAAVRRAGTDR